MLLEQFINFHIENTCTVNTTRHVEKNACFVQYETFHYSKHTAYSISLLHYPETRQSSPCRKKNPSIQTFLLNLMFFTVHLGSIPVNNQLDAQFFFRIYLF